MNEKELKLELVAWKALATGFCLAALSLYQKPAPEALEEALQLLDIPDDPPGMADAFSAAIADLRASVRGQEPPEPFA
ncbi:MAG: hypothetical protein AB7S53_02860 [Thiomonas sp.]